MDYFADFGNDRTSNIKIEIMLNKTFVNKKILIYGLGLSGNSCFKYLYKKNNIKIFDDNYSLKNNENKKFFLDKKEILDNKFD